MNNSTQGVRKVRNQEEYIGKTVNLAQSLQMM